MMPTTRATKVSSVPRASSTSAACRTGPAPRPRAASPVCSCDHMPMVSPTKGMSAAYMIASPERARSAGPVGSTPATRRRSTAAARTTSRRTPADCRRDRWRGPLRSRGTCAATGAGRGEPAERRAGRRARSRRGAPGEAAKTDAGDPALSESCACSASVPARVMR